MSRNYIEKILLWYWHKCLIFLAKYWHILKRNLKYTFVKILPWVYNISTRFLVRSWYDHDKIFVRSWYEPLGHDIKFNSFKTNVAIKSMVILRNLITTNHRRSGRSKNNLKFTEIIIVTTWIRYRVNGWLQNVKILIKFKIFKIRKTAWTLQL